MQTSHIIKIHPQWTDTIEPARPTTATTTATTTTATTNNNNRGNGT